MAKIIRVDIQHQEQEALETIKGVLCDGGVIAFPTDTFYGLGANPFNERAVANIFKSKNRSPHNPILVLIGSLKQLDQLACDISPDAKKLIQHLWPVQRDAKPRLEGSGPLTLLFKALPHLPRNLTAGTGKIGVRLPDHDFSRRLIAYIDHPLTASSANLSNHPNARTAEEVNASLGTSIDLIINGGQTAGGKESTVLDTTVSPPKLIREGAISKEQIEDILALSIAS